MRFQGYNPELKELARKLRNNSTKAEIKLWRHLRNKQMMGLDFQRQKPLGNFIADFFCPEVRLVVEIDGYTHRFEDTINKDKAKNEYFRSQSIEVIRFTDDEVFNDIQTVIKTIKQNIEQSKEAKAISLKHTP
jgi:very-short-patch-repair endonuclease